MACFPCPSSESSLLWVFSATALDPTLTSCSIAFSCGSCLVTSHYSRAAESSTRQDVNSTRNRMLTVRTTLQSNWFSYNQMFRYIHILKAIAPCSFYINNVETVFPGDQNVFKMCKIFYACQLEFHTTTCPWKIQIKKGFLF